MKSTIKVAAKVAKELNQ